MHPLTHIYTGVNALKIENAEFIFGLTAPDIPSIFSSRNGGLRYYETHNAAASAKLKNKDLAQGFAAHYAVDVKCHNHGEFERGFSFYTHNVPEYLMELWVAKTNPEVFTLAEKMYSINVDEVASDMADAFQKDFKYTKSLVNGWFTVMRTANLTAKVMKNLVPNIENNFTNGLDDRIREYIICCAKLQKTI